MDDTPFFTSLLDQYPEQAELVRRLAEEFSGDYDPARLASHRPTETHDTSPSASSAPDQPTSEDATDSVDQWQQYVANKSRKAVSSCLPPLPPRAAMFHTGAPLQGEKLMAAVIDRRRRLGLTQAEFAERLGISLRTYQEWEQGRRRPSGPAESMLRRAL